MKRGAKNKIAYDISFIRDMSSTGVGNYALRILSYIVDNNLFDSYILLLNYKTADYFRTKYPQFESYIVGRPWFSAIPYLHYFFWMYSFQRVVRQAKASMVFCPYGNPINCWKTNATKITVLHDMQVRIDEKDKHPKHAKMYIYAEDLLVKHSKYIFTISEFAKKQILSFYPEIENKLLNMSNLVEVPDSRTITPMLPGYPYLLYVGRLTEMKNVMTLIKAFVLLKDRYKALKLVLLSNTADYWEKSIVPFIVRNGVADRVLFIKGCGDDELMQWYRGASIFVFPSLREGFGLPPIEAGMMGVPVITSKRDSLEEVTLGLLNYYEPASDEYRLAYVIRNVMDSPPSYEELYKIKEEFYNRYSIKHVASVICNFLNNELCGNSTRCYDED